MSSWRKSGRGRPTPAQRAGLAQLQALYPTRTAVATLERTGGTMVVRYRGSRRGHLISPDGRIEATEARATPAGGA